MPDTPEGRQFAAALMTSAPGWVELRIEGRTACDCGCGKPARIEFTLPGGTIAVITPDVVDLIVKTLQEVRQKLWGEP